MILVWLAGAFVCGVVAGTALPAAAGVWLGCAVIAVLGGVAVRGRFLPAALIAAAAVLGIWRAPHTAVATPADLAYYDGRVAEVTGVVDAEPDLRDTSSIYDLSAETVLVGNRTIHVGGRLRLYTSPAVRIDFGDRISVRGRLVRPRNTATGPWADVLARQGIRTELSYPQVLDLGPAATGWRAAVVRLRVHIEDGIDQWLPEPEAALLIAIALGARSASLGDLNHALVVTGLIHLVAISGIKVSLVAGTVYQLIQLTARRLASFLLPVAALWGYIALTNFTASGTRSAIMWTLVFAAAALGRRTVALVSLAFAAATMVALDPALPWDLGFEMSTLGTLAIVAFAPILTRALWFVPPPFREAGAVTVAAQIGTLPIVIEGFHVVSVSGTLANALVLPLIPALIAIGLALGMCSGAAVLAAPLAALAHGLVEAIILIADALASIRGTFTNAGMGAIPSAIYYGCVTALGIAVLRRANWVPVGSRPVHAREFALAGVVGASGLTLSMLPSTASHDGLTWLGTGQAILARDAGQTILIDGSPRPFVLLERLGQALPFDAHTINLVVVTDPRAGNILGLQGVLQHYRVLEVLDVGTEYPSTTYASWRAALRGRHIPVYALRTGASVTVGEMKLQALAPDAVRPLPTDSIGILRVSFHGTSYILAGASGVEEEHEAVFRQVKLKAQVLVSAGKAIDPAFRQSVAARRIVHLTGEERELPR